MENSDIENFYEFLLNNKDILEDLKEKRKDYTDSLDFIEEVLLPLGKDNNFNLNLEDFIDYEKKILTEEELEQVSGGTVSGKKILIGLSLFTVFSLSGLSLINKNIINNKFNISSQEIFKNFEIQEEYPVEIKDYNLIMSEKMREISEINSDYNKIIEQELNLKREARNLKKYPTSKKDWWAHLWNKDIKSGEYGYGEKDFINNSGLLKLPEEYLEPEILENPEPNFEKVRGTNYIYSKEAPLFRHDPHINDIFQGQMGNCYFESALIAILKTENGSKKILEMMKDNGDGTVTVRIFNNNLIPCYFKIEKSIPKSNYLILKEKIVNNRDHVIWPAILMKACIAAMNLKKDFNLNNNINILGNSWHAADGGSPSLVFERLLGIKSSFKLCAENPGQDNLDFSGKYTEEEIELYKNIKFSLEHDEPVACGTRKETKEEQGEVKNGIALNHAYAITEIKKINNIIYIGIINPWRTYGRIYSNKNGSFFSKSNENMNGFSYIELHDFFNTFLVTYFPRNYISKEEIIGNIIPEYIKNNPELYNNKLNKPEKNAALKYIKEKFKQEFPDFINIINNSTDEELLSGITYFYYN